MTTLRPAAAPGRDFCGVGFHVFDHAFDFAPADFERYIARPWRELRPRFARMNHQPDWSPQRRRNFVSYLKRMQETDTTVYLTTWNPPDVRGAELSAYAEVIAAELAGYFFDQGCTNLRYYCMSNELTLKGWGTLMYDLPRFRDYHAALHAAFARRALPVGLLATDAAPLHRWHSLEWAANEMDDISAAYGAHDYFSDHDPDDASFYPWFQRRMDWAMNIFRDNPKPFIIGECGARQDGRVIEGVTHDACIHWGTPQEPYVGLQVAEAAIAAINAGMHALGYWTFCDFPDRPGQTYLNKWGVVREAAGRFSFRAPYYAIGLLTRYLRGPAQTWRVASDDPRLRAAALRHADGGWTLAVVNRGAEEAEFTCAFPGDAPAAASRAVYRQYAYETCAVPLESEGLLPPAREEYRIIDGALRARLPAQSLSLFTQD